MPPLLPPLKKSMQRQNSDWAEMPPVLPPLDQVLQAPPMIRDNSEFSGEVPEILPLEFTRSRSRPVEVELPSSTPELPDFFEAPAPFTRSYTEPTFVPQPITSFASEPILTRHHDDGMSSFVPYASINNANSVYMIEQENLVPTMTIPSPTQQFAMPTNLNQIQWGQQNFNQEVKILEPSKFHTHENTSAGSPDAQLVDCDPIAFGRAQDTGLPANPNTALALYHPNLAPRSRKATEQYTALLVGKYQVIVSNLPCNHICAPVKGTDQICHTFVFPYIAKDVLGNTHCGLHFQTHFVTVPSKGIYPNTYVNPFHTQLLY